MKRDVTGRIATRIADFLARGERIESVAVQRKLPARTLFPRAVLVTGERVILYRPRLFGRMAVEHFRWRDVRDVAVDERLLGATLRFRATENRSAVVAFLPRVPARRICAMVQEHQERARREESVRLSPRDALPPESSDPAESLGRLERMLSSRLISVREYEAKREEILSRM